MPSWVISEADIKQHPKYGNLELHQLLWDYGMDTTQPWADDGRWLDNSPSEYPKTHRSVFSDSRDEHLCPRYVGKARQDGVWKKFVDRFLDLPLI